MKSKTPEDNSPKEFLEGVHYYFENGLMVLTARFLSERGYCCGNICRHCPYPKEIQDQRRKSSISLLKDPGSEDSSDIGSK
ncbi:MAG: hypothetical protein KF685_12640 [Acidobacteria bacterium]|nr:hypothetical protein [Acidobacteriota bacterium]